MTRFFAAQKGADASGEGDACGVWYRPWPFSSKRIGSGPDLSGPLRVPYFGGSIDCELLRAGEEKTSVGGREDGESEKLRT